MTLRRLSLPLVLLVALGVALTGWVRACNQADRAERAARAERERQAEAHRLEVAGLQAAKDATARELADRIRANDYLHAYAEEIAAAGAKAKPIAAFSGTTGPVDLEPGVTLHLSAGGNGLTLGSPSATPGSALVPPPSGAEPVLCKAGEIRIPAGAVWVTDKGNVLASTTGEAWCADPRTLLFRGPVRADVSTLKPPQTGRGPSWGTGVAGVVTRDGWSAGPALAAPPLRLWSWQIEPTAAFTLGGSGQWAGAATVIVRRSR